MRRVEPGQGHGQGCGYRLALPAVAVAIAIALLGVGMIAPASAQSYPIAGLTPSQRPQGAPTITKPQRDDGWEARLFRGVSKPYPASVQVQQRDQGSWYTPFNRPGMLPPYDPRGWHAQNKGK